VSGPADTGAPAAPEVEVASDLARRAIPVAAVLVIVSSIVWGAPGAWSSLFSVALVVLNFVAAARLIAWGARISQAVLMGAVLGGYVVRMAAITAALWLAKDASWAERVPLFGTLLITHVGLLVWEARYVSASLAFPGLAPRRSSTPASNPKTTKEALPS
jgi:hypothetical protein